MEVLFGELFDGLAHTSASVVAWCTVIDLAEEGPSRSDRPFPTITQVLRKRHRGGDNVIRRLAWKSMIAKTPRLIRRFNGSVDRGQ